LLEVRSTMTNVTRQEEETKNDSKSENDRTTTGSSVEVVKTVYLVRHAESEENRRLSSLKCVGRSLLRFALPSTNDIASSLHLINIPAQVNSAVSEDGQAQIANVAKQLSNDNFWQSKNIQLTAYSPLQRARGTAAGFLKTDDDDNEKEGESELEKTARILSSTKTVPRVVEIEELLEKTPAEWIPGNSDSLRRRISALEMWLSQQPETNIVCVGHSQFFKAMLQLDFKFGNCDVWQIQLNINNRKDENNTTTATTSVPDSESNKDDDNNLYPLMPPQWYDLKQLYKIELESENEDICSTTEIESKYEPEATK